MRIRLQVQRHQLPPTKVLWNVEESATTVDLLTQINNFFPLEDEGWGLEDYAVHIGGYELLHFQQLGSLLKDDDEVVIQPLQTNDIRARVMTGRRQISQDGRHLVDGIAYGRPLLRPPTRPSITIPPRRQIEAPEAVDPISQNALVSKPTQNAGSQPPKLFPHLTSLTDNDQRLMIDPPEELRRLFEAIKDANQRGDSESAEELMDEMGRYLEAEEQASRPGAVVDESSGNKKVSFLDGFLGASGSDMLDYDMDDYDEEEEDDEDWVDEEGSMDESDVSKDDAPKLLKQTPHKPVSRAEKSDKAQSQSGSDSSSEGSDQDSDKSSSDYESSSDEDSSDEHSSEDDAPSEEGIQTEPPSISIPPQPTTSTPTAKTQTNQIPNEGKGRTRARNHRRRDTKKLNYLKAKGILPKNATRQTYIEWRKNNAEGAQDNDDIKASSSSSSSSDSDSSSSDSDSDSDSESGPAAPVIPEAAPAKPTTSMVPRQIKVKAKQKTKLPVSEDKTEEFQQKREALLAALQSGGVDINQDLSATATPERNVAANGTPNPETAAPTPPETRRARLDVSSTNRLLFNSLGVRAPKNEADRQRLQAKFAENQRKPVTKAAPAVTQPAAAEEEEGPTDPEAWKSKISLSAVECMPGAEEYYYTTPPFPFYQRWDPSQQTKKRKRASQAFATSKAPRTQEDAYEDYSEHFNDNGDDTLNYDDDSPPTTNVDTGAHEDTDNEAASAQLLLETSIEDDFPPLPSDLSTLPALTSETTTPGTVIVFQRLEVSAATNWAPALAPPRTALIRAIHDDKVLELELAKRDLPQRQYDESGRRMFDKFEMITGDEEEEEGVLEVEAGELVDARVLVSKHDGSPGLEGVESKTGDGMDVSAQDAEGG